MVANITGVLLNSSTYKNKLGVEVPISDVYIAADGDTVRVYGYDSSSHKKFETVTLDVQIMNGQNGLYVRLPKS